MDICKMLDRFIDTSNLTDEQCKILWRHLKNKESVQ